MGSTTLTVVLCNNEGEEQRLMTEWRRQHPLSGTRGTLVAHPGWIAPRDWADAVLASELMQERWQNELPFSKELFDATEHRGRLTDEKTRKRLIQESEALRARQAKASREEDEARPR